MFTSQLSSFFSPIYFFFFFFAKWKRPRWNCSVNTWETNCNVWMLGQWEHLSRASPARGKFRSWTRMKFQTVSRKPHFRLNMIRCRRCSPLCSIETTGYRLSYISIVSRLILPNGTRLGACDCFERFRVLSTFIVQCTRLATAHSNYMRGSCQRLSLCGLRPFMENIRFKRKCFNILYNFGTLVKSRKCDL